MTQEGVRLQDAIIIFVRALQDDGTIPANAQIDWGATKPPEDNEQHVFVYLTNGEFIKFSWALPGEEFEKEH